MRLFKAAVGVSVKVMLAKANEALTGEGHVGNGDDDQALAWVMKPNLVRALIQHGALR